MEEHGDEQNDDERGEGSAQRGAQGSLPFVQLIADEGADVDGEHAGTALGNGDEVEQFFLLHPMMLVDHLFFYHGYHGVATAKGDYANLKEGLEGLEHRGRLSPGPYRLSLGPSL